MGPVRLAVKVTLPLVHTLAWVGDEETRCRAMSGQHDVSSERPREETTVSGRQKCTLHWRLMPRANYETRRTEMKPT